MNLQLTSAEGIKCISEGINCSSKGTDYSQAALAFVQLTILIIYDRLCSLFFTTDLLKNCCLACVGPAYDKDTKTGTVVALLEYFHIPYICINYKLNILYKFSWPT